MELLNWGDTLCGKEITPAEWRGGATPSLVVERRNGTWHGMSWSWPTFYRGDQGEPVCPEYFLRDYRPIYPPAGWAGKTESELWEAMCGEYAAKILGEDVRVYGYYFGKLHDEIATSGAIRTASETAPILLALQNAMLLSKRLKEATE